MIGRATPKRPLQHSINRHQGDARANKRERIGGHITCGSNPRLPHQRQGHHGKGKPGGRKQQPPTRHRGDACHPSVVSNPSGSSFLSNGRLSIYCDERLPKPTTCTPSIPSGRSRRSFEGVLAVVRLIDTSTRWLRTAVLAWTPC